MLLLRAGYYDLHQGAGADGPAKTLFGLFLRH
jgi:hypothetical protein